MKQLYIRPATILVYLETNKMITTSIEINSSGEAVDAKYAAGRSSSGSFWEDDEE